MNTKSMIQESENPALLLPDHKRIFDVLLALLAMPILALITLFIAIVMRMVSPGPVFFKQIRVGKNGRQFRIFKFRTMKVAADTSVHHQYFSQLMNSNAPMVKLDSKGDCRLITGGWFLRATGLDELPQLINVLLGDMSLVGPRPCLPGEYEQYTVTQRRRFDATPGLTGLWQVSGKNRTTFDEMIRLDIRYTEEKSFWLDLYIICMTIPALLIQLYDTRKERSKMAGNSRMTETPFPMRNVATKHN
jgi:lipopolysaccharide/colanic/teichoic acid biosynthesis glycosyltransferase